MRRLVWVFVARIWHNDVFLRCASQLRSCLTTRESVLIILCHLPEVGRKGIEKQVKKRKKKETENEGKKANNSAETEEILTFPTPPLQHV